MIFLSMLLLLIYTDKVETESGEWCASLILLGALELALEGAFLSDLISKGCT